MDARHLQRPRRDKPFRVAPAQAIALGIVAVSIGWAVWLLRDRPSSEEVELLAGMSLPSSETAIMEAAFDRAGLADHRTEGGRVWVPRSRQSAYMRALVDAEALPREFGGSLRRALEKNSPWQSRAVQDELVRVATQEELAMVICSMPGIERAAVLYDTEPRPGFDGGRSAPARTASVNVRTQPDAELDATRVQAIRVLVSASIAGLVPERVAVTDLRSGRVHSGPLAAEADRETEAIAAADPHLARRIAHEQHLATKLRQALAFVKGAVVDVAIDFSAAAAVPAAPEPADPASLTPAQKTADANAPAEIEPVGRVPGTTVAVLVPPSPQATDLPDSVVVSIAVPESYLQAACRAAAERAGQPRIEPFAIEQQEVERIRRHVLSLVPATRDPAARRVVVTTFPVAGPVTGRREALGRGPAAAATASPPAGTPREVLQALAAGRFADVPRTAWLAGTSVCVGLLSGLLWWLGGRGDPTAPARSSLHDRPSTDDLAPDDEAHDRIGAGRGSVGRAAAVLLAVLAGSVGGGPCDGPGQSGLCAAETAAAAEVAPEPPPIESGERTAGVSSPSEFRTLTAPAPLRLDDGPAARTTRSTAIGVDAPLSRRPPDWRLLAVLATTFAALATAAAVVRRRGPAPPPPDVFEVLSTASLGGQHSVRIVRFGPKTLLVAVSATGCHTLAEVTDPQAAAAIAAACRGGHSSLRPQPLAERVAPSTRRSEPRAQPAAAATRSGEAA